MTAAETREVTLMGYLHLLGDHRSPGPELDLPNPFKVLYTRVAGTRESTRDGLIHETSCALAELGAFIAGEHDEHWTDTPGQAPDGTPLHPDGPTWHRLMSEWIADAVMEEWADA